MKLAIIALVCLGAALLSGSAYGVQLDAEIPGDAAEFEPSFRFVRVVFIDGPLKGELFELLPEREVRFSADSREMDLGPALKRLNEGIGEAGSTSSITDVRIEYQASSFSGNGSARIEYSVTIIPVVRDHIRIDGIDVLIDSRWRGFTIDGPLPVEIEGYGTFDVNNPADALKAALPQAYEMLKDEEVLSIPLIDASPVLERPISRWHFLFDPTSKMVSAGEYGFKGALVSVYNMERCNVSVGVCSNREWTGGASLDGEYMIRVVEPQDDAVIQIEGYASVLRGSETIAVTGERREGGPEEGFQSNVMYGMTAAGIIGTVIFFWVSSVKSKKEGSGQTGIDPSALRVRETSLSAGGYRTNRGESYVPRDPQDDGSRAPVRA